MLFLKGICFFIGFGLMISIAQAGIGHWATSGPYGEYISVLAGHPTDSLIVYAGTGLGIVNGSGIYKSTDAGRTWRKLPFGTQNAFWAIVVDSSGVIYASADSMGVYHSSDGGMTWDRRVNGLGDRAITALALDLSHPNVLFAGGLQNGVYKTTDFGMSWSSTSLGGIWVYSIMVYPGGPDTVFATSNNRVYRSSDGGATWSSILDTVGGVIAPAPSNPSILYVWSDNGYRCVWRSNDGGRHWIRHAVPSHPGLSSLALLVDPAFKDSLLVGGGFFPAGGLYGQLWKSTDGGISWTQLMLGDMPIQSLLALPQGDVLVGSIGPGVHRTTDGGATWLLSNQGMTLQNITSLDLSSSRPPSLFASCTGFGCSGVVVSKDQGRTWQTRNVGIPDCGNMESWSYLKASPLDSNLLLLGAHRILDAPNTFRTNDGGGSWSLVPPRSGGMAYLFNPLNPNVIYSGGFGPDGPSWPCVFKSTNSGDTFVFLPSCSTHCLALGMDPFDTSMVYAGGGQDIPGPALSKTTDGGAHWFADTTGLGLLRSWVLSMVLAPDRPGVLYLGTDSLGVFKSTDGGGHWVAKSNGLTNLCVCALITSPRSSATAYAGTRGGGVFVSTNGGDLWTPMNDSLGNMYVQAFVYDSLGSTLYAATRAGVYAYTFPVGVESENPGVLKPLQVQFIVQSPAHRDLNLTYALPYKSKISLVLYDLSGRKAVVLEEGLRQSGLHTIKHPLNLPSGIYFLRLESGGVNLTRKLIVVR